MKKITLTFNDKLAAVIAAYATKHNVSIPKAIQMMIAEANK